MKEKRQERTRAMRLAELELGCRIEEYIERRTAEGWTIPKIAGSMGVTPECLRGWIRQFGGVSRIEFPEQPFVEAGQ